MGKIVGPEKRDVPGSMAGYGSLKNCVETRTNHRYYGVDVLPRIPGVMQSTSEGFISQDFMEREGNSFSYVASTNVFQHFSARQRAKYVEDASSLLHQNGLFLFNLTVDTGKIHAYMRDKKGGAWAVHYGQYTSIPKPGALYDLLARTFDILDVTNATTGFSTSCARSGSPFRAGSYWLDGSATGYVYTMAPVRRCVRRGRVASLGERRTP